MILDRVAELGHTEVEADDLVGGAGSGSKFPVFDGLCGLLGKNRVPAEDGHFGHGSVGEHGGVDSYNAADARCSEKRRVLGLKSRDGFAAGENRSAICQILGFQGWRAEVCQADNHDCRRNETWHRARSTAEAEMLFHCDRWIATARDIARTLNIRIGAWIH